MPKTTLEERNAMRKRIHYRADSKTRKSLATRQRIMDAAAKLMVEQGNTAFQMSEISRMCGMSKGALYYYFSDKEDLVNAVFDSVADELVAAVDDIVGNGTEKGAEEILMAVASEFVRRVQEGSPLAMALVRELVRAREGTMAAEDTRIRHLINVVSAQFERAKAEGKVRADLDERLASVAICGAFTFAAISSNDANGVKVDFADDLLQIVLRGIA